PGRPRSWRGNQIACMDRLVQDRCEFFRHPRAFADSQFELRVGESQLAFLGLAEIATCLEVLHGNAELSGKHAQRLDRWATCACLDPRDVGVRDARRREVPLREATLQTQALETFADRFGPEVLGRPHWPAEFWG